MAREDRLHTIADRLRSLPPSSHSPVSNKCAAVLVALFEDSAGVAQVWLTQRASHLKTHQGEVCLPGGKRDEGDADDVATALREAREEIGLQPGHAQVLCVLQPFLSKHMLSVVPVVAQVPPDFQPAPNPAEVAAVFHMPLASFLDTRHHLEWDMKISGGRRWRTHSFAHQGFVVWGLTASILIHTAEVALGRPAAFDVHGPRGVTASSVWFDGTQRRVRGEPEAGQQHTQLQQQAGSGQLAGSSHGGSSSRAGCAAKRHAAAASLAAC